MAEGTWGPGCLCRLSTNPPTSAAQLRPLPSKGPVLGHRSACFWLAAHPRTLSHQDEGVKQERRGAPIQEATQEKGRRKSQDAGEAEPGDRGRFPGATRNCRVCGKFKHERSFRRGASRQWTAVAKAPGRVRELVRHAKKTKLRKQRKLTRRREGRGETRKEIRIAAIAIFRSQHCNITKCWVTSILRG